MNISEELKGHHAVTETIGQSIDFKILVVDGWLMNSLVEQYILPFKGQWVIKMVYFYSNSPIHLIIKTFDAYPTEKKALLFGGILKRTIGRDIRGDLKINKDAFNICYN